MEFYPALSFLLALFTVSIPSWFLILALIWRVMYYCQPCSVLSSFLFMCVCVLFIYSCVCVCADVQLRHCTQALAVLYVAGEQGASLATQRGMVVPGSLRKSFIDALHYMDEDEIRRRADIDICSAGV